MGQQAWVSLVEPVAVAADGTALASSTSLTDISPAPQPVIPANSMFVGAQYRVTAMGRFSTTSTPTLLIGAYVGGAAGVAACATSAITTASSITNVTWRFQAEITVRTIGSGTGATVFGQGMLHYGTSTSAWSVAMAPASAPAASSGFDSTAAQKLTIAAQWGTNNASNTITCHSFVCEALNA